MGEKNNESSSTLTDIVNNSTRASLFLILGNVAATIIQAIGVLFVARVLGPELYGVYTISLIVPSLALLLSDLGIDSALIKYIAAPQEKVKKNLAAILRIGLLLKFSISVTVLILCMILSEALATFLVNRSYISFYLRLASLTIIFQALISSTSNSFIGLGKSEYNAIVNNTQAIGKVLIASLLVILGLGVFGALIGLITGYVIGLIASLLLFYKSYRQLDNVTDDLIQAKSFDIIKNILSYGLPLYVTTILIGIGTQYQNIILASFVPNEAIGNFNASLNFITLMSVIGTSMSVSIFQGFSKLSKIGQVTRSFFTITTKYTTLLMVPVALFITVFSKELIEVIYGISYYTAASYLSFYALVYLLTGLGSLTLSGLFNGLGETNISLKMQLVSFLVLLILAPLLTSFFGVIGIISAIFISYLAGTLVGLYFLSSKIDLKLRPKELGRIYVTSILPALFTFFISQSIPLSGLPKVLLAGVLYLIVYLLLLIGLRVINNSELEKIKQVTNHLTIFRYIMKPFLAYMSFIMYSFNKAKEVSSD